MKKHYLFSAIVCLFFFVLSTKKSNGQSFKDVDKAPHDIAYYRLNRVTKPLVKVLYGRPKRKGAPVFGNIVPYGKVWRTGANEATEIKFYKEVTFGDVTVAAGTYVLYTIPGKRKWEIILNSKLDVLGAFQYNANFDIARITVNVSKAEALEAFSIAFKSMEAGAEMVLAWDTTRIKVPLLFKEESSIVKR